ncbi:uncharacterized protein HMPREF1541_06507 [Cyphellophora europaea CBS 101466]|uniref:DUF1348-domain-containing protein n=1 Tax=Cyphellophora europaea (strain CBS 101466) TaxID=1220924 RepID=W2RPT3_CYPE1|nr:uncharacterized protein HMPREF1541_06507 [Cyphellophora europaea CBS 101466]ETN38472.1 hypothetical protein HMPREF1541_06507 [Cyphellophora europaea CBS 101466]
MASLKPPFTKETAHQKLKFAQDMWNTKNPEQVAKAYTPDCIWRNRDVFIQGTEEIIKLLTAKWEKEKNYRLRKELFCVGGDSNEKIAVQFWYEYQDLHDGYKWKRCYGLEDWTFNEEGKMRKRMMSGNDVLLGIWGSGEAIPERSIEGRWFLDGVDVEDESVTKMITEKHY